MSLIAQIKDYDLVLGYSFGPVPQGMTGHLFECIEYYYILKDHFNVCIAIGEMISKDFIRKTIQDKYTFTENEINELIDRIHIFDNPKIFRCKNLLLADGHLSPGKMTFLCDNLMAFPCNIRTYPKRADITVFQDDRLYEPSISKTVNYIKKVLLDKYKPIQKSAENVNLVYTTRNLRGLPEESYSELEQYKGDFLLLTDADIQTELSPRFKFERMPVKNLMEKFSTYIYTPLTRKFDCSPRFLVECKYYGKDFIFHNVDYWDTDHGLKWRVHDIENNFDSLFLRKDDHIIELIGNEIG